MLPEVKLFLGIAGFLFGSIIGSFLNVVIWRVPRHESIVFPGSHCPKCNHELRWYDNIPFFSWLFLLAKCRYCKAPISFRYPFVEFLTGAFMAAYLVQFGLFVGVVWFVFTAALIAVTFIDLDHKIIPDAISLPGIPIGLALNMFVLSPTWLDGLIDGGIGILGGGGILLAVALGYLAITKREGMGLGDPKLLAMIGAFCGWKGVIFTMLVGSFVGTIVGLIFILAAGKDRRYEIPFGPFLSLGAVSWIWIGPVAFRWYFGY